MPQILCGIATGHVATGLSVNNVSSVEFSPLCDSQVKPSDTQKIFSEMGKCVVKECDSRSQNHNKSTGITFHTVPKDERRVKWVEIIRLLRKETDWIPSKSTAICSKHFCDHHKIATKLGGRVYLSNEAIPKLNDDHYSEDQVDTLECMDEDAVETDEEIDEITETPQRNKMRRIIHHLKNVSARRLTKIKSLSQKNIRLEIKNKRLQDVIQELKNTVNNEVTPL